MLDFVRCLNGIYSSYKGEMSLVLIMSCLVYFKWFRKKSFTYRDKANMVAALDSTWGTQILNVVSSWTGPIMVCLGCRGWFG